jgi:hypothetical protein
MAVGGGVRVTPSLLIVSPSLLILVLLIKPVVPAVEEASR